jgi:mannose-6-phosphate isomerase
MLGEVAVPVPSLYPLRFRPILRQYLWGGRKLGAVLGKHIGPDGSWAESWEVCDHGPDQSIVEFGPLEGITLGQLVAACGEDLLGRHYPQPRFPLLLKFLDAAKMLSVQVHPNDEIAARLNPPDLGKTEAWVVLEVEPGGLIYAGLKPGVDRQTLVAAIAQGRCQDCLHSFRPSPGDCIFLPAGTVHAFGGGVLVAEIQQSSDATLRLFDWNRLGPDGKPRPLHVEQALEAIDFERGPVAPQQTRTTERPPLSRLVECPQFTLDRWKFGAPLPAGGDRRCHVIAVLEGAVRIEGDPAGKPLSRGESALLPAGVGPTLLTPSQPTVLLDAHQP